MKHRTGARSFGALSGEELGNFPLEERVLVVLAQQPLSSCSNLAKRLKMSDSDLYEVLPELESRNLVRGRELGATRRAQLRYVLARRGVMHVTKPFEYKGLTREAMPLTWQMTEEGVTKILHCLPMIESLYEILPTFWTGGLLAPFQWQSPHPDPSTSSYMWMGRPTLMGVLWLPRGRLHVVTNWQFDRGDRRPSFLSIPVLWYGLLPQEDYRSRSLRLGSDFIHCPRDPEDQILWDRDPQAVAIATDTFAAFRARTAYGDDVQIASVDTAGAFVWSAEASHSEWAPRGRSPQARSIGHPEAAAIEEGPDLVNLGGRREYRIFCFVAEFRACTKAHLATAFPMSRGAVNAVIEHLTERGLITNVDKNLYVTQRGKEMLAARDRVDGRRLVEVTYVDPNGEDAKRERRHDEAVAAGAAKFMQKKISVAAGWRRVVPWSDGQLVPDLWVQLVAPGGKKATWVAVELEFSARTPRRIEAGKLRSYRLAPVRLGKFFPVLVITGEASAARLFDELSGDLPMLVTTLREFLTGVWEGPDSVWRRKGRPAQLQDIASEDYPHLQQRTGRSLDYDEPSFENLVRLIREESIWSDPWAEDFDAEPPPMGPPIPAAIKPVSNTAKAELPARKPVSAQTPQTPPAAPVKMTPIAESVAIGRSEGLGKINGLLAVADRTAASRVNLEDISEAERLCLARVRAIISYGFYRHSLGEGGVAGQLLQRCLGLEDDHRLVVRSRNPLRRFMTPPSEMDPYAAFENMLREYPTDSKKQACDLFGRWCRMVDDAAQAARKARTLESETSSGDSAG